MAEVRMQSAAEIVREIASRSLARPTTSQKAECAVCRGTGWVRSIEHPEGGVTRCECQRQLIIEERVRVVLEDWPEYAAARLDGEPQNLTQIHAYEMVRRDPRGSYFIHGFYSSGKTHLMIAQYKHLALARENCVLRSSRQLMEELRKAEAVPANGQEPFESPVLQMVNLAKTGHLFWDDMEKAAARLEFRAEMVFDLLDTIKRRQLSITVTSNVALCDLTRTLGDAAVARLDRRCTKIQL